MDSSRELISSYVNNFIINLYLIILISVQTSDMRGTISSVHISKHPINFFWDQKDGNASAIKPMKFNAAGSKTISRTWMVGKGDSPNPRWMQIIITDPVRQEYDRIVFENNCP